MPQPSQPPNRSPLLSPGGYAAPAWQQWITSLWAALTGRAFYIPTSAGAPTFTPETRAGFVAMVYDATNNALYAYDVTAETWKKATLS